MLTKEWPELSTWERLVWFVRSSWLAALLVALVGLGLWGVASLISRHPIEPVRAGIALGFLVVAYTWLLMRGEVSASVERYAQRRART